VTTAGERTPDIDVVRSMGANPEIRAAEPGTGSLGTLVVRFSPFNTWYEVNSKFEGRFMERTVPGAFADTVVDDRAIMRSLFDHGQDPQIGNKVLGPILELREDADSPIGIVDLMDTSYNRDLLPGLKAGVYGSSFRMHVRADDWNDRPGRSAYNPDGIPERTVMKTKTMEFGPVTFPASPTATAAMRSMTDQFYAHLRAHDARAYETAVRAVRALPAMPGAESGDDPAMLAQAACAAMDAAMEAMDPAAMTPEMAAMCAQACALMTAADTALDALLASLGAPDLPDMADMAGGRSTDFTGRPTRGVGGGDPGAEPEPSTTPALIRQRLDDGALRLRGILQ
jgi:HK97 family phage prohead protease